MVEELSLYVIGCTRLIIPHNQTVGNRRNGIAYYVGVIIILIPPRLELSFINCISTIIPAPNCLYSKLSVGGGILNKTADGPCIFKTIGLSFIKFKKDIF